MNKLFIALSLAVSMWGCGRTTPSPSPTTTTLSGVVFERTASGMSPLDGIEVTVRPPVFNSLGPTVMTDANGSYHFTAVPAVSSQVDVQVTGAEYGAFSRRIRVDGETRLDVELVRRSFYTLSGVVSEATADGLAPAEAVRIDVFACDGGIFNCPVNQYLTTTTDKNGYYSVPGMWGGQETGVWATKAGYKVDGPRASNCDGCDRLITASADTRLDLQLVH